MIRYMSAGAANIARLMAPSDATHAFSNEWQEAREFLGFPASRSSPSSLPTRSEVKKSGERQPFGNEQAVR